MRTSSATGCIVRLIALSNACLVADAFEYPTSSAMRCHVQPCARSSITVCSLRRVSTFPALLGLPFGTLLVVMFISLHDCLLICFGRVKAPTVL